MKKIDLDEFDDSNMFANDTIENLKKDCKNGFQLLKIIIDGKPKNINPLTEIPEPQMRLFGFSDAFNSVYFETEEELIEWAKEHNRDSDSIRVMDYLGTVAGRSDVIRVKYPGGKDLLFTHCDEDGYGIYNYNRSIYRGEFIWEYSYGSISDMYKEFRDRGIVFENDIYAKIEESKKELFKKIKEINKKHFNK